MILGQEKQNLKIRYLSGTVIDAGTGKRFNRLMKYPKISFIGVGIMGSGIVKNLQKKGIPLKIFARDSEKITQLRNENTEICRNISDCYEGSDIAVLCLTEDSVVRNAFFHNGLMESGCRYILDIGTSSPELTEEMKLCSDRNGKVFMDSPMTGSRLAAEAGEILYMLGCDSEEAFEFCRFFWENTGRKIIRCGSAGSGQRTKISLNMIQASVLQSYIEGLMLARNAGIDEELMYEVISSSAARSGISDVKLKYILNNEFYPHFSLKNMNKDLNHALRLAMKTETVTPLASALKAVYSAGMNSGLGEEDFSSLYKVNKKLNKQISDQTEV